MTKDGLLREMGIESWYLRPEEKLQNKDEIKQSVPNFFKSGPKKKNALKRNLCLRNERPAFSDHQKLLSLVFLIQMVWF
ncbi:MAG: hypothetical protein Ct9H90mP27_3100 [Gammaproteobacteria bacterium]|nr:MAG: hypothetical protein Ct9H90mP27_3100 [Gammaproteobacteria bacterium]